MDETIALDSLPINGQECSEISDSLQKIYGVHPLTVQSSKLPHHQPTITTQSIPPHKNSFVETREKYIFFKKYLRNINKCEGESSCNKSTETLQQNGIIKMEYEGISRKYSKNEFEQKFFLNQMYLMRSFLQKSLLTSLSTYFCWSVLFIFALLREFLRKHGIEKNLAAAERPEQKDFVPLFSQCESIYERNCYMRVRDVFERPITSAPGATVKLLDRYSEDYNWNYKYTESETEVINVGSYNYMGFAETDGLCGKEAAAIIDEQGLSTCCSIQQLGFSKAQHDLEKLTAQFLGVDDAICFSMGFAVNSLNTPCLADENSIIISDQFNHASLILGSRMSGATVRVFKHNDMTDLEKVIRDAIVYGNPKTKKPFTKILIIVEGIYSMEGSICNLPAIIALKKKYGAYIYLDEAHSIGALGRRGRGVVDYWGCDPRDVDILMGTFTKSFSAAGGYIAGDKRLINYIRANSATTIYALPMSPPIAQQIISSIKVMMGLDGTNDGAIRRQRLRRNTHYFRKHLKRMGCIVYGSDDSPIVPIMLYYPSKCGFWGREMLKRRVGIVVVSFPATNITESRIRICLSAAHTKEMLNFVLDAIKEVAEASNILSYRIKQKHANLEIDW
uniref:serine C-palmitoyltransferase n=1 Tax=Onchocerca volvulus TaxID=6282 RepID=A0A8R1XZT9_ONCVO